MTPKLILASQSPRRAEVLRQMRLPFSVHVVDVDETPLTGESPAPYVQRLARTKAAAVDRRTASTAVVIGADTAVYCDGSLLTKPRDALDNHRMLAMLSGRSHQVFTGVCVSAGSGEYFTVVSSEIEFVEIDAAAAAGYVRSGEGLDKAGGYAIQGLGAVFVKRLAGSYSAVVGLPIAETEALLRQSGVDTWWSRAHEV